MNEAVKETINEIVKTVLIVLAGMIPGIAALYANRKKTTAEAEKEEAEASDKITQSALILVEPLKTRILDMQKEINDLRAEVTRQREMIDDMSVGIYKLIRQIESLEQIPVWRPKRIAGFDDDTVPLTKE